MRFAFFGLTLVALTACGGTRVACDMIVNPPTQLSNGSTKCPVGQFLVGYDAHTIAPSPTLFCSSAQVLCPVPNPDGEKK